MARLLHLRKRRHLGSFFSYKIPVALLFVFILPCQLLAQITPKEDGRLHYRIIGFSFPPLKNSGGATLEIAKGTHNTDDSFSKNIISSIPAAKNKVIAEVPYFGCSYTWRIVYPHQAKAAMHHFSTTTIPALDTNNTRLRIINKAITYKDAYVFLDGTRTLYDMNGKPVWYLPNIGSIGTPPRDMKLSPAGTITFLLDKQAYEISYDGRILWKGPNDGKVSGRPGESYHHEFTRLKNGHYMVLGKKTVLWELSATSIDSSVLNAPGEIIIHDNHSKKYYQKMELGTVIEYDHAGNVVWSWDPSAYLKRSDLYYRRTQEGLFDLDVHENSFYFDEKNKMLYISLRDVSRVVKIQYPSGKVISAYGGKYKPGTRDVESSLFCYQHSCKRSSEGYLYLFNNNGCNSKEHPRLIMMKEPAKAGGSLKKVWEYECALQGMDEKNGIDSLFTSGGNVVELPDRSIFASMCVIYGNVFIIGRDKKITWNAIAEKWNAGEQKWEVSSSYRASIILGKELEQLVSDASK